MEPSNFNPATNRISDAGWEYSARGELTRDPSNARFASDGENKMVLACTGEATCLGGWQAGRAQYMYDADGQRVRADARDGGETIFVYDAAGRLAAEYSTTPVAAGRRYLTTDHLGSTRLVTDASAAVLERHDYQPFGVELLVTSGSPRYGVLGYGQDGIRQKFTGKERDPETALDYFIGRYYSGPQGRFLSPDAPFVDQDEDYPQSWNLYSYTRNNPLAFIDEHGDAARRATGYTVSALPDVPPSSRLGALATGAAKGFGRGLLEVGRFMGMPESNVRRFEETLMYSNAREKLAGDLLIFAQAASGMKSLAMAGVFTLRRPATVGAAFKSFEQLKAFLGPAGDKMVWHHIVEQSKVSEFGAEAIHNTANVVRITREMNIRINAYYSSKPQFTGGMRVETG